MATPIWVPGTTVDASIAPPSPASDRRLLAAAERAAAEVGLPVTLGGLRRRHLLVYDALSTTWAGWAVESGETVWLQILRPRWQGHPALVRRFLREPRAPSELRGFEPLPDAAVPTRVLRQPGTPLRTLAPIAGEDGVCLPLRASIFAQGLNGLAALHREGRGLSADVADWLTVGPKGPAMIDPLAFGVSVDTTADLRSLAQAMHRLAPSAEDPLATLARTWSERPPPSAEDGALLVARAMASHLAWLRHQLVRSRRSHTRGRRIGGLSRLLRRLETVQAPPIGTACLAVLADDQHVVVVSDGTHLRGGPTVPGLQRELPLVWSPHGGLDPVAGRLLLRAWAQCSTEARASAAQVQSTLGTPAVPAKLFVRWLRAARRLRSGRLLLDAEARVRVVPRVR